MGMTRNKVNFVDFIEVLSVANTHKLDLFPAIRDVTHGLCSYCKQYRPRSDCNIFLVVGQNQTNIGMTKSRLIYVNF